MLILIPKKLPIQISFWGKDRWDRIVKLQKFLGKWNRETETDSWTLWQSDLQPDANGHEGRRPGRVQNWDKKNLTPRVNSPELSSLEITSKPQLYFSIRPRKAAKPGGPHQDQLQRLNTTVPDHSVEIQTLKGHMWRTDKCSTETLPLDLP